MFKIQIKAFIIIFIIFLISSCIFIHDTDYFYLEDSCRSNLEKSDTLVFLDQYGNRDTLIVFNKVKSEYWKSLSGSECDSPQAIIDVEYIYLIFIQDTVFSAFCNNLSLIKAFGDCSDDPDCDETILFSVMAKTDKLGFVNKNSYPRLSWYGNSFYRSDSIISSMEVNESLYENIFHFYTDKTDMYKEIREIYYSPKEGIIRMIQSKGTILNKEYIK